MLDSIPPELLRRIQGVTNKRARLLLDMIVENGRATTEELSKHGLNHPPRAARDVRELGIPLKMTRVKHSDGRSISAYFLDLEGPVGGKSGRRMLPKKERDALLKAAGSRCQICEGDTNLQVDHRIPYEVAGESQAAESHPFQILDGSCNRKKSWSCEHCDNWLNVKDIDICRSCYWAEPSDYNHIAMRQERRAELVWIGDEIQGFERIRREAKQAGTSVPDQIKRFLTIRRKS